MYLLLYVKAQPCHSEWSVSAMKNLFVILPNLFTFHYYLFTYEILPFGQNDKGRISKYKSFPCILAPLVKGGKRTK